MTCLVKATIEELDLCLALIEAGKKIQANLGIAQWSCAYPDRDTIRCDLIMEKGYLLKLNNIAAGYVCLDFNGEEAYQKISGEWLYNGQYAVLHRLAINNEFSGMGLASQIIGELETICSRNFIKSLRADTAPDNLPMRKILLKRGFSETGTIVLQSSPKIAYEKILF